MKFIDGGVCAAKGFKAGGIHCGIRKNRDKKDLSLIYSKVPAAAAAVYTTNLVKGAPLTVTKRNIENGTAQAVICNSGNANTCNADGIQIAEEMCRLTAEALKIAPEDVVVASTGVIGQPLDIAPIAAGMKPLAEGLRRTGNAAAAEGIMTTDTRRKEAAVEFELGGKRCRIGGMAKGSGMIHPNMVSIDGDTSTNDMVSVLANGLAGNELIDAEGAAFDEFKAALNAVTVKLCRMIAADGEGATKLLECKVSGAKDVNTARTVARSVICSSFRSAAGTVEVCKNGAGVPFSETEAKKILSEAEIEILVGLNAGSAAATAWGCDLTYDYVKINGDYRT